ncbi:MAG: cell division protein ZapA [Ruminococcus sp.]|nr:cell division protein ZapA [Ruminococcus sp.]
MKNIVNVTVFNRPFSLSTDEPENYIRKIAAVVDERVRAHVSENLNTNVIDAAILAALESVDERLKAQATIDNLRAQIKDYVDDAGDARLKCDEAQKEVRALKAKCDELQKELEIRRMFNKKIETEAAVKAAEEHAKKEAIIKAEAEKKAQSAITAAKLEAEAKALAAIEEAKAQAKTQVAIEQAKAQAKAKADVEAQVAIEKAKAEKAQADAEAAAKAAIAARAAHRMATQQVEPKQMEITSSSTYTIPDVIIPKELK